VVQFDNQLNPGNSGGPVLDASGKVVGVAVATVRAAALNMAIPVGRLADFLAAPGLSFEPPPLAYNDRERPVSWTIGVQPPTPGARLPEDLSITVTVPNEAGEPRTFKAEPVGDGTFRAKVTPTPRAPERKVELDLKTGISDQFVEIRLREDVVSDGDTKFIASVLRLLFGGSSLPTFIMRGELKSGPTARAERTKADPRKLSAVDLSRAKQIKVQPLNWPGFQAFVATVDARQGSKVLATVRRRVELAGAPRSVPARGGTQLILSLPRLDAPPGPTGPPDQGRLDLGGELDIEGVPLPRGAGQAIRPPQVAIPAARLSPGAEEGSTAPLVLRLDGTISDVAVGGGGRYLLLPLKEARKLAIFDANRAAIVKTIPLPSPNALVTAGARKALIAYPDEKLIQRWDLPTLRREGASRRLPIEGPLTALVLGSDSDGPALASWTIEKGVLTEQNVFSLIDLESLKVLRVGLIASSGTWGTVSASGGSFRLPEFVSSPGRNGTPLHIRAAAGGALWPSGTRLESPPGSRRSGCEGRH
jgi:hypothetical protein